eukprot:14804800-Alexandrium_andersonii.AAC.1
METTQPRSNTTATAAGWRGVARWRTPLGGQKCRGCKRRAAPRATRRWRERPRSWGREGSR